MRRSRISLRGRGALALAGIAIGALAAPSAQAATPLDCIGTGTPGSPAVDNIAAADIAVGFGTDALPETSVGQAFSVRPTVNYTLNNAYLQQLGRAGVLQAGDNNLSAITFWVAVQATNTVEQRQVMRAVVNTTFGRYNGTSQLGDRLKTSTRIHWDAGTQTATVRYYNRDNEAAGILRSESQLAGTATLDPAGVDWTPTSATPVVFSVAPAGSFGALPVAAQWRRASSAAAAPTLPDPANPTASPATTVADATETLAKAYPYGSVYARISVGNASGGSWSAVEQASLDCVHGNVEVTNSTIAASEVGNRTTALGGDSGRYAVQTTVPQPIVTVPVAAQPRPMTCIDHLGRYVQREVNPYDMTFSAPAPAPYQAGQAFALDGATLDLTIDSPLLKGLYDNLLNYESLPEGGIIDKPFRMWIALRGENTAEGTQVVLIDARWTASFVDPDGEPDTGDERFPAVHLSYTLPATTWTPTGAGPVAIGLAGPGTIPVVQGLTGFGHSGAAGAVYDAFPHGSLYVRAETGRYGETMDCGASDISITDPAVAFSNLGRKPPLPQIPTPVPAGSPPTGTMVNAGSGGRYTITPRPFVPFVVVPARVSPPTVLPIPPAPAPAPAPIGPIGPSAPGSVGSTKVRIDSSSLTTRAGKIAVRVSCPAAARAGCRGTLRVRTAAATAVRRGARKRLITLTRIVSYTVSAGSSKTVSLALSSDAKTLLRRTSRVSTRIVATPSSGLAVTRSATLRR